MTHKTHPSTKLLHLTTEKPADGAPISQGPAFSSTFHLSGMPSGKTHEYGRFDQPNWQALETKLASLEGGDVAIFPSGMAAISAVLMSTLKSGDTVLMPNDGYYPSRAFVERFLVPFGIKLRSAATKNMHETSIDDCKLVFLESPSNPMLDVCDIALMAEKVHDAGGLLAVDNTTMTVLGQNPIALGADFSVASDTKLLNGHSDVLFGHVAAKKPEHATLIKEWRTLSGNIPGPMETWLVDRGLQTLDVRLERQTKNAQMIAEFLSKQPQIASIRYPGLKSDPSHDLAAKQMNHFGLIISFDLGSKESADQFMTRLKLITNATSFGGTHTLAERRKRWGTDDINEGIIRLSAGIEHIDDLLDDIKQALAIN